MHSQDFSDFFRAVSHELGVPDVEALEREGYVVVDDVAIGITPGAGPGLLDMVVDLCEVGGEARADLLEEALCINLELSRPEHGAIALEDETDHLVLTRTLAADADARSMAVLLQRYAVFASKFQHRM